MEGLLPLGCGVEAVFNFSWEKELVVFGSGDGGNQWPTAAGTVAIPTRSLLSTAGQHRTTRSTTRSGVGTFSVTPNRLASRLPPHHTPSPESRHSSFQHLLRLNLNAFNQRLSMLERNTLDMKEGIHSMEDQQSRLSSHLKELIAMQAAGEKSKKVVELEKSYTDMEARLSRLEGRLEILIDGFTALAQEMNKMKRARHTSRSPQERRALPSLATVLAIPLYSTPQPPVRITPTETPFTSRATVPKSIPTPGLPVNKSTSAPRRDRKLKSAATTTAVKNSTRLQAVTRSSKSRAATRSSVKLRTTLSKPKSTSKQTTVKPETKKPGGRKSSVTTKRVSQLSKTKPKEVEKEAAITKFQLEPPSHKPKPAKPDQANKKGSASPSKNNGRNKAFRSDAPAPRKAQGEDSKGSSKPHKGNSNQNEKKEETNSKKLVSHETKNSGKNTVTTTKPTKVTAAKKSNTLKRTSPPAKTKATTVKKKSNTTVKRKTTPPKTKSTASKKGDKKPQKKKKTHPHSSVLDLLQLLNGDHKSWKEKKNQDGSLHVVLGRLAIPIKIIPDY